MPANSLQELPRALGASGLAGPFGAAALAAQQQESLAGPLEPIATYGVTHVHLLVQDAERAARFYRDVFGCTEVLREEFETERLIFVSTPGTRDLITLH